MPLSSVFKARTDPSAQRAFTRKTERSLVAGSVSRRFLLRGVTATFLSYLFTGHAGAKDQPAPDAEKPESGLEVKLTVKPTTLKPNSAAELVCSVSNRTDKPIQLIAWGLLDVSVALEVLDSNGNAIAYGGGRNHTKPLPADVISTLKPNETKKFTLQAHLSEGGLFSVSELGGGVWTWQLKPGSYQIKALYDVSDDAPIVKNTPAGTVPLWTGKSHSSAVKVTVE